MNVIDLLTIAVRSLASNGKRTALSLVGMSIGVAAVLVLTSLGEGARRFVMGQFESLGSNTVGVVPGRVETSGAIPGMGGGAAHDLTLEDALAVQRALPEALHVAPISMGNETVSRGERRRQTLVIGTTAAMLPIRDIEVRSGRFLPDRPWDRGGQEVVLGAKIATELFPGASPLGQKIRVGSWPMRVVGVLQEQGMQMAVNMDETVYVPVATGLRMFDRTSLFRITVQVRSATELEFTKKRVAATLAERHGEEDFTVVTEETVVDALGEIFGVLTLGLAGIAAISLSVAGIGIMNVMLVTVSERQSEVGLLKALGAAPRQILSIFLTEAAILSLAGALLGLAAGELLVRVLVEVYPSFPATPPWWAAPSAMTLAILVGVLFGGLPARRAMRLDPVVALSGR